MSAGGPAVEDRVFQAPLRAFSILASLVVLLSFAAFAIDQARSGSQSSQAGIARDGTSATPGADSAGYASPTPAQEKIREAAHGAVREALDDADDVLLAPFASVTENNSSSWMRRSIPGLLALAVYGFGVGFLSRFAAGKA
jgi:hypothetical protein